MKYQLIELLFAWMDKPLLHLSFIEICTVIAEVLVLSFIIQVIYKIYRKVKGK